MAIRRIAGLVAVGLAAAVSVAAEEWSHARISRLPDQAFAVIETAPDGRRVRHLPHHDETGALDLPHLKAARSRLPQVKWLDPASAAVARAHLEDHAVGPRCRELRSGCRADDKISGDQ